LKILVALSRFPWPTNKGDKLRAWHQLLGMSNKNEVHIFCLTDEIVQPEDLEKAKSVFASVHVCSLKKMGIIQRLSLNVFQQNPTEMPLLNSRVWSMRFNRMWFIANLLVWQNFAVI
jgi:hypothetical protein